MKFCEHINLYFYLVLYIHIYIFLKLKLLHNFKKRKPPEHLKPNENANVIWDDQILRDYESSYLFFCLHYINILVTTQGLKEWRQVLRAAWFVVLEEGR